MKREFFQKLITDIIEHPKLASILGATQAFAFGLITIDSTMKWVEVIGELVKFVGILAGASVAVFGFVRTFFYKQPSKPKDTE